jgi:hypothetical protein
MALPQVAGADPPRWLSFMLVLAGGVALSGFADFALSQAGYAALGAYVWAVGYAGTVLLLFALYLRPLELTGPDGEGGHDGPEGGVETDR